jgi:hypothetical protein
VGRKVKVNTTRQRVVLKSRTSVLKASRNSVRVLSKTKSWMESGIAAEEEAQEKAAITNDSKMMNKLPMPTVFSVYHQLTL